MSERFAFVNVGNFADQNLSGSWHSEACQFSDFCRWLTNDRRIQCAIFQDDVLNGFQLFTLQQVAAMAGKTLADGVVDGVDNHHGLFRSTDNAVIEGFRHQYRRHCAFDISRFINNNRRVARANADSWFTGAISGLNHTWAAGGRIRLMSG